MADKPNFWRDQGGNVFIIVGFSIFVLLAFAGSGVDIARSQIIKLKMHQSADAAALAAGSLTKGTVEEVRTTYGRRYFQLNYPEGYMSSAITADDAQFRYEPNGDDPETVAVDVDSDSPTNFVSFIGDTDVQINSTTEVGVSGASRLDVDVVMVLDTTGSMENNGKIEGLIIGARAFVDDILNPAEITPDDKVRMSILAYDSADSTGMVCNSQSPSPRSKAIKYDQPFTDNPAVLKGIIDGLKPLGCTDGGYGAIAGKARLDNAPPRSDGKTGALKVWIFMTDGIFNRPSTSESEQDFVNTCNQLELDQVVRYTIRYGGAGNLSMLRNCASQPDYFFDAPSPNDIITAFEKISIGVKGLRINK